MERERRRDRTELEKIVEAKQITSWKSRTGFCGYSLTAEQASALPARSRPELAGIIAEVS